jgi:2'-5' RNA ligase
MSLITHRNEATRIQLSLYVPGAAAIKLEAIRQLLDPLQSSLIPAHVTLCREDELASLSKSELQDRLSTPRLKPITLHFGRPESFHGHGILLACTDGEDDFHALRERVLGSTEIRRHRPHITLAHPRNPRSPNNCLSNTSQLAVVTSITFSTVCWIQQRGNEPWELIQEFEMPGS